MIKRAHQANNLTMPISVFQIRKDPAKPLDDVSAQYHYVGTAPQV